MICLSLQLIRFPLAMLEHGARMEEPAVRPGCQFSDWSLSGLRRGKDSSINDMLKGGSGFTADKFDNREFENAFDMGCQQEQRDLRSLTSTRSY